jgi:hypothetical protein
MFRSHMPIGHFLGLTGSIPAQKSFVDKRWIDPIL